MSFQGTETATVGAETANVGSETANMSPETANVGPETANMGKSLNESPLPPVRRPRGQTVLRGTPGVGECPGTVRSHTISHHACRKTARRPTPKVWKLGSFGVLRIGFVGSRRAATLMFDIHDLEQFGAKLIWAGGLGPGPGAMP